MLPQGERDIYRVTFSDGSSTQCDFDHLWQIRRHRNRAWRVENLGSIKEKLDKGGMLTLTVTRNGQPTQIYFKKE